MLSFSGVKKLSGSTFLSRGLTPVSQRIQKCLALIGLKSYVIIILE